MRHLFRLEGKVALVTGGGSGIGRAIASALASAGASVAVVGRRENMLTATVDEIEQGCVGKATAWEFDLMKRDQIPDLVENIKIQLGNPDILVNAAGVNLREKCDDISTRSWDTTLELNLSVPFFLARSIVPGMKEKKWGKIINVASLQSERAFPNSMPYGASKGGVCQLTRAMAEEWSKYGICCNAIGPGFFSNRVN